MAVWRIGSSALSFGISAEGSKYYRIETLKTVWVLLYLFVNITSEEVGEKLFCIVMKAVVKNVIVDTNVMSRSIAASVNKIGKRRYEIDFV